VLGWAGLVCVLAYTLGQWREIAKVCSRRQARYGTLAATSVLVVLGILVAINYIGARQNKRWDLTVSKQCSLSDQSRNVLTKLDSPLQVLVFAQEPEFPRYRDKLKEYEYMSKKVTTEYIDPDKKPTLAKQNQIQQYGTIVFNYKGRTERVTPDIEALKKYLEKSGKLLLELDPPDKADSPPLTNLIALAHDWGVQVANNVVVDVSGMGRLIGTDASVPVAANYPSHPITQRFTFLTAFPLAREASPISGGVNGHIAQTFVETSPRSWAETDIKSLLLRGEGALDESKGDKKGPVGIASAVSAADTPAPQ